jgi:hypothetical protein
MEPYQFTKRQEMARMLIRSALRATSISMNEMHVQSGPDNSNANQRAEPRARTLKGGRVVFNGGYSSYDCTIRNLSSGGAMLQFASTLGIPNAFDLFINNAHGEKYECTVRWRTNVALGVEFVRS